ncbi:MAG: flagellar hook-length control protein FliK [Candidatus Pacebacteria bacterium]|nr:flagellar hook-length control protein FliK [Candidatus Paceibacterota bacterium]
MVASVQNQARTVAAGAQTQAQAGSSPRSAAADLLSLLGKGSGASFAADFNQLIKPIESKNIAPSQAQLQAKNSDQNRSRSEASSRLDDSRVSQKLRDLSDRLREQNQANQADQDEIDSENQDRRLARTEATNGQIRTDEQTDSDGFKLDDLTPDQQQQLVDRLAELMARILADQGEGLEPSETSTPSLDSNEQINATDDPLMALAERVLAIMLAAAQGQVQAQSQSQSQSQDAAAPTAATLQTNPALPRLVTMESQSPLLNTTDGQGVSLARSVQEIDPEIKKFIQSQSDAIRAAFVLSQQDTAETPRVKTEQQQAAVSTVTPLTPLIQTEKPLAVPAEQSPVVTPSSPLPTAVVTAAAADLDIKQAQAVLQANQAEFIASPSAQSQTESDASVTPLAAVAVTTIAETTNPLSRSDSHSLHSNPDAGEPISAAVSATFTAESRSDSRGGSGNLGAGAGESPITLTPAVSSGAAAAVGNDFASLVANSNFLTTGNSPSVTQTALSAATNPAGLQPLAEQIARPLFQAAVATLESVTVQIHPASLGLVRINLSIDNDKRVKVAISVTRPETLKLLESDPQSLLQSLRDAGLITDDQTLQFNLDQSGEQNNPRSSFTRHATPAINLTALQELDETPIVTDRQPAASLVDIQI